MMTIIEMAMNHQGTFEPTTESERETAPIIPSAHPFTSEADYLESLGEAIDLLIQGGMTPDEIEGIYRP